MARVEEEGLEVREVAHEVEAAVVVETLLQEAVAVMPRPEVQAVAIIKQVEAVEIVVASEVAVATFEEVEGVHRRVAL